MPTNNAFSDGNAAASTRSPNNKPLHRRKKRNRFIHLFAFFLLKAVCSLVMLNFYMGSQISIVQLEDSVSIMLHRDNRRASNRKVTRRIADRSNNAQAAQNSTIQETMKNTNDQSNSKYVFVSGMITPNLADGTLQGKESLYNILKTRNVTQVDADYWASVPTWNTILRNIHHKRDTNSPIIYGLETCQAFQSATSSNPSQRRIAPAGIFNTGTNYLSVLLEYNCQNPHRVEKFHGNAKRGHGNEWEVPWGKHTPASSRGSYTKDKNPKYTVDEVLPVVLIRNPYGWMKSMCRNPYTAKWKGKNDAKTCPQLKTRERGANSEEYNHVDVQYGSGRTHHKSLGHLWNDWYGEYIYNNVTTANDSHKMDASFPRLIIRFEDIIFYPYEVTKQVCECAGGVLGHRQDDKDVADDSFHYVVRSAKAGVGHGPASQRNGLVDSWTRYGKQDPEDAYSEKEVQEVKEILDPLITGTFGYS